MSQHAALIEIIAPTALEGRDGNSVTARRWAARLRELGHRVRLRHRWDGESCDLLVALHARKSADSVRRFARAFPDRPLVVALTGTDLYHDLPQSEAARRSLELATCLVLLQPLGRREVPARLHRKCVVIYQSARRPRQERRAGRRAARPGSEPFDVAVLAHLRPVKDPLRAAMAARLLPAESRIRVLHAGRVISASLGERARLETRRNPRYRWLGDVPHATAERLLARSRLLVLSSRHEGGANVISEAVAAGRPILASRVPGCVGLLGPSYPGYFEPGDTRGLAALLRRAETDPRFRNALGRHIGRRASLFRPARESASWARLLRGLLGRPASRTGRSRRVAPHAARA